MARRLKGYESSGSVPVLQYQRPHLYLQQAAFVDCLARYVVVEASSKSGKTSGCLWWLLEQALRGQPSQNFWWIEPTYSMAKTLGFDRMVAMLRNTSWPHNAYEIRLGDLAIRLANGTTIWFKGAENDDALYGEDIHGAIMDEASRYSEVAWFAIRTTLTKTQGKVRLIGNVIGTRNWVYLLARKAEKQCSRQSCQGCEKAKECAVTGWKYFRLTAYDAVAGGILDAAEVADAKMVLPEVIFRQLYLAEASDATSGFFRLDILRELAKQHTREPILQGELDYKVETLPGGEETRIHLRNFHSQMKGRLKLWCVLNADGRPSQETNYVAFSDIGEGVFAANSVCYIADVMTREVVGCLCTADLLGTDFAEYCVALWKWFGGKAPLMAAWESNGPGAAYGRRIWQCGYGNVLGNPDITRPWNPIDSGIGWRSSREAKDILLSDFRLGLARGKITIRDADLYRECEQYIYYPGGGCGPDGLIQEPGGARAAHGDRVIAAAGLLLVIGEQSKIRTPDAEPAYGSSAWFDNQAKPNNRRW